MYCIFCEHLSSYYYKRVFKIKKNRKNSFFSVYLYKIRVPGLIRVFARGPLLHTYWEPLNSIYCGRYIIFTWCSTKIQVHKPGRNDSTSHNYCEASAQFRWILWKFYFSSTAATLVVDFSVNVCVVSIIIKHSSHLQQLFFSYL